LQLSKFVSFLLEFAEVESELVSAIQGIVSPPDHAGLPAVVSKEIELRSELSGTGRFGRIHTAFHPQLAVDQNDCRLVDVPYARDLLDWFQLLLGALNSIQYRYFLQHFPPIVAFDNLKVSVVHLNRPLDGTGLFAPVDTLHFPNRRWGTMRRRGAVVRH
jgi:hypothetical protein